MMSLSQVFGIFFQGSIKSYTSSYIKDDKFLSIVGTVASFCRILVFIWSIMMETYNFKTTYAIVLVLQVANAFMTPVIIGVDFYPRLCPWWKKVYYVPAVISSMIANGAHHILFPVILAKIYGTHGGLLAYSVGFTFQAASSFLNTLLVKVLYDSWKFRGLSWLYGGFLMLSFVILVTVYKGS